MLKDKLALLPSVPGVYFMKDAAGGIIYVGKSKNLKQRVQSYFHLSEAHSNKVRRMVSQIKDLDIHTTDTEFEALLLECSFIHKYKPVYNKKMKNTLAYTYIVIQPGEARRRIRVTQHPEEWDEGISFGPYTSSIHRMEEAVQGILDSFRIDCNQTSPSGKPCLNYSLGKCIGLCVDDAAREEYERIVDRIHAFFSGRDQQLILDMEQMMEEAAERYDFEGAVKFRDRLNMLVPLQRKNQVIEFMKEDHLILCLEPLDAEAYKLFLIHRNKVLWSEAYPVQDLKTQTSQAEILSLLMTHLHERTTSSIEDLSRDEIDEAQIIYSYLQGNTCKHVLIPKKWLSKEYEDKIAEAVQALIIVNEVKEVEDTHEIC